MPWGKIIPAPMESQSWQPYQNQWLETPLPFLRWATPQVPLEVCDEPTPSAYQLQKDKSAQSSHLLLVSSLHSQPCALQK